MGATWKIAGDWTGWTGSTCCWLNEDCTRGYQHEGECRFPSWHNEEPRTHPNCMIGRTNA